MKRSMFVLTAAMVCLTLMGVAYAAWTQNIVINGSVATGTFDIIWTNDSLDRSSEPQYQGSYVANVTESLSGDYHTITYTVTNAYPGWSSKLNCKIKNNGSIPANLAVDLDTSSADITVSGYDTIPASLAAGATTDAIVLTISVPSSVTLQGQTYTFTLTVTGTQFNVTP